MEGGTKKDAGKPRICLVPMEFIEQTAQALGFGANKYGDYNYRKGLKHSRIIDSAFRHLMAYTKGEDNDPESGLPHLAHCAASIAMLIWMKQHKPELDDRYDPNTPD